MKEYALYKGEECLAIGTVNEIAEQQKVKPSTIYFYKSNTYKKRGKMDGNKKILIEID